MSEPESIQPLHEAEPSVADAAPRPLAPPTTPGAFVPAGRQGRAIWPIVLGIVALVYAGINLLIGAYGILTALMMSFAFVSAFDAPPDAKAWYELWAYVSAGTSAVQLLLSLLLAWSAVELIRRRARAATLLRGWAWVQILFVLVSVGLTSMFYVAQMDVMFAGLANATPPPGATTAPGAATMPAITPLPPAARMGMMIGYLAFATIMGLGWGWPLPIFLIVWLRRQKVRDEVRSWREAAA